MRSPEGGQIIVEYVLLLAVAVTIGLIVITQLVKRDADSPEDSGTLIIKWRQIQDTIGRDNQN